MRQKKIKQNFSFSRLILNLIYLMQEELLKNLHLQSWVSLTIQWLFQFNLRWMFQGILLYLQLILQVCIRHSTYQQLLYIWSILIEFQVLYTIWLQHIQLVQEVLIKVKLWIEIHPSSSLLTKLLARPKSASFMWHSELRRMLDGFKSRCNSSPLCKNLIALRT